MSIDMRLSRGVPYGVISAGEEPALIARIADLGFTHWGDTPDMIDYHGVNIWPAHTTYQNFTADKEKPTSVCVFVLGDVRRIITTPFRLIHELRAAGIVAHVELNHAPKKGQLSLW